MASISERLDVTEEQAKYTPLFEPETHRALQKTVPGMAHFVDMKRTDGATCRTCKHWIAEKLRDTDGWLKPGKCVLWRERMSRKIFKKWPKIKHDQKACRYHELNEDAPKAKMRVGIDGQYRD